mmetsp:Transcript_3136/g.10497  ORF Transcript_3136/g.10497 Transcript_3136/m.10497 type:complete len:216 (+) Transcript_3136:161-808(+)
MEPGGPPAPCRRAEVLRVAKHERAGGGCRRQRAACSSSQQLSPLSAAGGSRGAGASLGGVRCAVVRAAVAALMGLTQRVLRGLSRGEGACLQPETRSEQGTSGMTRPPDSGSAHTLAAATRQRAAKRRSGAPAEVMMSGARMAPSRPQPDPQPIPELRHSVGKISAATMYATLTAATDAKRPASTAVMASGAPPPAATQRWRESSAAAAERRKAV